MVIPHALSSFTEKVREAKNLGLSLDKMSDYGMTNLNETLRKIKEIQDDSLSYKKDDISSLINDYGEGAFSILEQRKNIAQQEAQALENIKLQKAREEEKLAQQKKEAEEALAREKEKAEKALRLQKEEAEKELAKTYGLAQPSIEKQASQVSQVPTVPTTEVKSVVGNKEEKRSAVVPLVVAGVGLKVMGVL